jgi:hypothetical protein
MATTRPDHIINEAGPSNSPASGHPDYFCQLSKVDACPIFLPPISTSQFCACEYFGTASLARILPGDHITYRADLRTNIPKCITLACLSHINPVTASAAPRAGQVRPHRDFIVSMKKRVLTRLDLDSASAAPMSTGSEATGDDATGKETAGNEIAGNEAIGKETTNNEAVNNEVTNYEVTNSEATSAQEFRTTGAYIPPHARGRPPTADEMPLKGMHPYFVQPNFAATLSTYMGITMPESLHVPPHSGMNQYLAREAALSSNTPSAIQSDASDSDTLLGNEDPTNTTAHLSASKRKKNKNKKTKAKAKAKAKKAQAEEIREKAPNAAAVVDSSQDVDTSKPEPRPKLEITTPEVQSEKNSTPKSTSDLDRNYQSEQMTQVKEKSQPDQNPAAEKKNQSEQMVEVKEMSRPDQNLGSEKNKTEEDVKSENKPDSDWKDKSEQKAQAKEVTQPDRKLGSTKNKAEQDLKSSGKPTSENNTQSEQMVQAKEMYHLENKSESGERKQVEREIQPEKASKTKNKVASFEKTPSEQMIRVDETSQPDQKPSPEKKEVGENLKSNEKLEVKKELPCKIKPQTMADAATETQPDKSPSLPATSSANARLQSKEMLLSKQKNLYAKKQAKSLETVRTGEKIAAPSAKTTTLVGAQPDDFVKTDSLSNREPQKKHIGESTEVQDRMQLDSKSDLARIFGPLPVGSSKKAKSPHFQQQSTIKKGDSRAGRNTTDFKAMGAPARLSDPTMSFDKEKFEAAIGGHPITVDVYNHIYKNSSGDLSIAVNLYLNEFQPGEFQTVSRKKGHKPGSRSHGSRAAKKDSAFTATTADPPKPIAPKATPTAALTGASNMKPTAPSYAAAVSGRAPVAWQSKTAPGNQNSQRPVQADLDTKMDATPIPAQVTRQQKSQQRRFSEKSDHRIQLNPSCNSPLNQAAKMQGKHAREKSSTSDTSKQSAVIPALPRAAHSHKNTAMKTDTTADSSPQRTWISIDSDSTGTPIMATAPKLPMAAPVAAGAPKIAAIEPSKATTLAPVNSDLTKTPIMKTAPKLPVAKTAAAGVPKITTPVPIEPSKASTAAASTAGIIDDDKTATPATPKAKAIKEVAQSVFGSLAISSTSSSAPTSLRGTLLVPKKPDGHNKHKSTQTFAEAENGVKSSPKLPRFASAETENKAMTPPKLQESATSYQSAKSLAAKDKQTLATIKEKIPGVLAPDSVAAKGYETIRRIKGLYGTWVGDNWDGSAKISSPDESNTPTVAQSHGGGSAAETGRPVSALGAAAWENTKYIGAETVIVACAAQDGAQDEKTDHEEKHGHEKKTGRVLSTEEKPLYISGNTLVRPGYAIEDLTPLEKSTCITWEEATGRRTPRPVPWTEEDWAEYPASNTPSISGPAFLSSEVRSRATYNFHFLTK